MDVHTAHTSCNTHTEYAVFRRARAHTRHSTKIKLLGIAIFIPSINPYYITNNCFHGFLWILVRCFRQLLKESQYAQRHKHLLRDGSARRATVCIRIMVFQSNFFRISFSFSIIVIFFASPFCTRDTTHSPPSYYFSRSRSAQRDHRWR